MTPSYLVGALLRERDDHGNLKLGNANGPPLDEKAAYRKYLWLIGITQANLVETLYKAHRERINAGRGSEGSVAGDVLPRDSDRSSDGSD